MATKLATKKRAKKKIGTHAPTLLVPSERMQLIAAPDLTALAVPKRNRHLANWILANQIGMIYGPRGKGKTWLALALAIAMSTGALYLGRAPTKPRKVIYLDGEMDMATLQARLIQTADALDTELTDRLRLFTPESFKGLLPALTTAEGQREIDLLIGTDWNILIIDNYSAWSGDGRETAEAWTPVMRWMLAHKHAGRTVIVIHHTGKNGEQRGSSRHEDALDWSVALQPAKEEAADGALRFTLHWKKARHLPSDEATPITVTMRKGDNGHLKWEHIDGVAADQRMAKALALKDKNWTNAQIAKELGVDRSTIGRWLGK